MQTHSYTPAPPLSFFIDTIWFSTAGRFDYTNLTLPMLHHELIITFSDQFDIYRDNTPIIQGQSAWLSGLQTGPIQTITGGRHHTIGILFKPWGLQALTGIDASEFQDRSLDLESIFGSNARQLVEQLHEQVSPAEVFKVLEPFLLIRLSGRNVPPYLLASLAWLQTAEAGDGLVNRMAREVQLSPKTLIAAYKKYIGVTPGKYHHLLLLDKLLHQLARQPTQKLTETGYTLNFFDQAHFIHFFRQYTGHTPSAYIRQYLDGNIQPSVPHSIFLS